MSQLSNKLSDANLERDRIKFLSAKFQEGHLITKESRDTIEDLIFSCNPSENRILAEQRLTEYKKRYPNVGRAWSQRSEMEINEDAINALDSSYSSLVGHFMKYATEQDFPLNVRMNTLHRISDFSYKFSHVASSSKFQLISNWLQQNKILTVGTQGTTNKANKNFKFSNNVITAISQLVESAQNKHFTSVSYLHGSPGHEQVLPKILNDISEAIGIEVLLFIRNPNIGGNKYLTGHVDVILVIGDTVLIVDYKPDMTPRFSTTKIYDNFARSFPQVSSYALAAIDQLGLQNKKVYSVTFNKEAAWVYEPEFMLKEMNDFMLANAQNPDLPWNLYFDL